MELGMDSVANSMQSINYGSQQANTTNQTGTSSIGNTPANASHVFLGVLNNQGNGRVDAWRIDALSPLIMRLVTLLNNEPSNDRRTEQQQTSQQTDNSNAVESPIATQVGDGFQHNLVDNTPFTSSTGIVNPVNTNANDASSGTSARTSNTQMAASTPFGSPLAAQVGNGFQSLLGNVNTTATNNDTGTVNPSHWRRGSAGLGLSQFRF